MLPLESDFLPLPCAGSPPSAVALSHSICLISPRRLCQRPPFLCPLSRASRRRPLLITAASPALPQRKRDSALPAHPPAPPSPAAPQCASAYFPLSAWGPHPQASCHSTAVPFVPE